MGFTNIEEIRKLVSIRLWCSLKLPLNISQGRRVNEYCSMRSEVGKRSKLIHSFWNLFFLIKSRLVLLLFGQLHLAVTQWSLIEVANVDCLHSALLSSGVSVWTNSWDRIMQLPWVNGSSMGTVQRTAVHPVQLWTAIVPKMCCYSHWGKKGVLNCI